MTGPRDQQPWLHDLRVTVDGPTTAVCAEDGDLDVAGAGIFVDDRRVVSELVLRLGGRPPTSVAAAAVGSVSEHWLAARQLGDIGADPTVEVHRRRRVEDGSFEETITVTSRAAADVVAALTVDIAGDGAETSLVKHGGAGATLPLQLDPLGWADDRHRTTIVTEPAAAVSSRPTGGARLTWTIDLSTGESTTVVVRGRAERTVATGFDADAGSGAADWDPDELAAAAGGPRLADVVRASMIDLRQLLLRDPEAPADVVAAAGSPWYLTMFGRDALWSARFMVRRSPVLAAGTLRALARRQARELDVETAAEPGKILHEIRRTDAASAGNGLPPLYFGTVDATALWIVLLDEAAAAGMAATEVEALQPNVRAALDWMAAAVERSPDGFLRYVDESGHGLSNQGWKDSGDAMRRADGTVAPAPIALLEAQGYAVAAAHAGARLLRATDAGAADRWDGWADELAARVRDRFWVTDDEPYLAMALDAEGCRVDGVGSNMGHVLGTGLLDDDETELVVQRLLRPDLLRRFGIATLSADNPGYNPIGYHTGSVWTHDTAIAAAGMAAVGRLDAARTVAERLVDLGAALDGRLPELCGGDTIGGRPVPYPAACRPQAWAAASAAVLLDVLA